MARSPCSSSPGGVAAGLVVGRADSWSPRPTLVYRRDRRGLVVGRRVAVVRRRDRGVVGCGGRGAGWAIHGAVGRLPDPSTALVCGSVARIAALGDGGVRGGRGPGGGTHRAIHAVVGRAAHGPRRGAATGNASRTPLSGRGRAVRGRQPDSGESANPDDA